MPRFVVLHHTGHPEKEDHYDLMLERGGALKTWIVRDPDVSDGRAVESFDHRLRYLDYEGPVSGGRGRVRRVRQGEFEVLEWNPKVVRIRLNNRELRLECEGTSGEGAVWHAHWAG